jgi:cytochrome c biogenesis protein CcmG/thiol:disulfide interchange protein DsbE
VVVAATATAVAMITLGSSPKTVSVSGAHARVGGPAPAFASWDLSGNKVSLLDFKGHPVVITFWATWCTACQEELPAMQRIRDRYQPNGLTVLALNYRESSNSRMSEYLTGLHVNLQAVIDPQGTIASAYGVDIGLPITVLLDRSETVVQIMIGSVPSAALEAAVAKVVGAVS